MPKEQQAANVQQEEPTAPSFDDIINVDDFPAVNDEAIAAVMEGEAKDIPIAALPPIQSGEDYLYDADGNIKRNKDGTPRKRRKRKKDDAVVDTTPIDAPAVTSIQAATVISGFIEQTTVTLISDEWQLSDAERASNIKAWEGALDYYGGLVITPPQALVINHLNIILTRAHREKTRSKIGKVKDWFMVKWLSFRNRKNAQSHHRPDHERQDNVSASDSRQG